MVGSVRVIGKGRVGGGRSLHHLVGFLDPTMRDKLNQLGDWYHEMTPKQRIFLLIAKPSKDGPSSKTPTRKSEKCSRTGSRLYTRLPVIEGNRMPDNSFNSSIISSLPIPLFLHFQRLGVESRTLDPWMPPSVSFSVVSETSTMPLASRARARKAEQGGFDSRSRRVPGMSRPSLRMLDLKKGGNG
jgi:hypothetical protein